jgi:DNA-binding PadR family transcriptional regulator
MSVAYALLGLLEEESPRHGYDLKRQYDRLFADTWPVKFAQVYATLGRLARDGRVSLEGEEPGRGPDRKLYAITREGVGALDRWLKEPAPPEPDVQSVLFMKVVLALVSDRPAKRFLEAQRSEHLKRMRELTRLKTDGDLADQLLADYALFHLEADLRWIELTQARLDRLRKEIRS